jgi:hypothetical protein
MSTANFSYYKFTLNSVYGTNGNNGSYCNMREFTLLNGATTVYYTRFQIYTSTGVTHPDGKISNTDYKFEYINDSTTKFANILARGYFIIETPNKPSIDRFKIECTTGATLQPTNVKLEGCNDLTFAAGNTYTLFSGSVTTSNGLVTVNLTSSCYNEGTKILCLNKHLEEEYIPIENLRKGDLVNTYKHGYKKIDLIGKNRMCNNPESFDQCMYKMEKTNENGLIEDLIITGAHSILVDDLKEYKEENDKVFGGETPKIDDKHFLLSSVSKDFIKMENTDMYTYYHFVLENDTDRHFGVWANGILSESTTKDCFLKHFTLLE